MAPALAEFAAQSGSWAQNRPTSQYGGRWSEVTVIVGGVKIQLTDGTPRERRFVEVTSELRHGAEREPAVGRGQLRERFMLRAGQGRVCMQRAGLWV